MWKSLTALCALLVVLVVEARRDSERHHHRNAMNRHNMFGSNLVGGGESTLEESDHRQGRQHHNEDHERRRSQSSRLPSWLDRIHGLMNGGGGGSDFFNARGYLPMGYEKPWWEGPNICPRDTEEVKNATESGSEIRRHFTSRFQFCDESETAYKCQIIEENAEGRREMTTIYECCHGFSRKRGDFGCPEKKTLLPLLDTAEDLGLKDFVNAVKLLKLATEFQRGNLTVFAPVDGSFGLDSDLVSLEPTIMMRDAPSRLIITEDGIERTIKTLQGAVRGHVVPGLRRSSNLADEEVLETDSPDGSTLRINYFEGPEKLMTVNCIRVASRDNMATNGVIHTIDNAIKPVTETLMDFVRTRRELSLLKTILSKANMVSLLEDEGKLTLLAPSDMAFMKMDSRLRERLLSGDRKCIERVLHNHLLPHVICSSAIQGRGRTANLLSKYLNVTRSDDNKLFVEDSQVLERDSMATNGVMHVIEELLVPDEALGIVEVLEKQGFTELVELLTVAGLTETMEILTNVTLFAPTNEAFESLSQAQKSRMRSDRDLLRKVLLYHLSPGENNCQHFYDNQLIPSSEGRQIRLNRYTNFMYHHFDVKTAQCAPMEARVLTACNGKIKVLHKVMMPPDGNVIDVLAKDKRFSTLVSLVKKADLANKLQEQGPYTIFAPNNEAFERVPKRTFDSLVQNPDRLLNFLKGHVYTDFLCCAQINRGWRFSYRRMRTMAGTGIRLTRDRSGKPRVGHAHITKCDRTATNGNILELDRPLIQEFPHRRGHKNWRRWLHHRSY